VSATARTTPLRAVFLLLPALCLFLWSTLALAFTPPALTGPVVDEAGVLDSAARERIAQKIRGYRGEVGPQIQVYLAKSLQGEPDTDVAYTVARAWKLGDAERDDGILFLIAPAERKVRIETGKGVGGQVTDLQADQIIRTIVSPRLKAGDYAGGVEKGVDALASLLGAQSAPAPQTPAREARGITPLAPIVVGAVLMIVLILAFKGGGGGRGGGGGGGGALGFLAGMWLGSASRGGGWSSGGGGWGGGGGGGGGWGGGGGDFGGGGASGDY